MTHLLSKVVRQTRLIALYALTGVIVFGLFCSFYLGRNERPVSTLYQTSQANQEQESEREVGGDCLKTESGMYDCTDSLDVLKRWRAFEQEEAKLGKEGIKRKQYKAVLREVCRQYNLEAPCEDYLLGMATVESGMGKWMVGDGGKSHGYFHVSSIWHKVPMSCLHDLRCSATWTLNRMIRLGYKNDPESAIRLHNGSLKNPKTLAYLHAVKSKMK